MKKTHKILASLMVFVLGLTLSPAWVSAALITARTGTFTTLKGTDGVTRTTLSYPIISTLGATVNGTAVSSSGSDLVVSNIYRDSSSGELVVQMTNQGTTNVTTTSGKTYIWIDDMTTPKWTYSWSTLSTANKLFMQAGQSSAIRPQVISNDAAGFSSTGHLVKACVDYAASGNGAVTETDENNNCTEATILSNSDAATMSPNLKMKNVYLERGNGQLVVEMTNIGTQDVSDLSGRTYIWIDNMTTPKWTYSWSTLSLENREFLGAGNVSAIRPQVLFGGDTVTRATVKACVDYDSTGGTGVVTETNETDNCLTVRIVPQELPQTYDTTVYDSGLMMGVSYPAPGGDTRVDFRKGNWADWLHNAGATIPIVNKVSFDPDGNLYNDGQVKTAWLNEPESWVNFSWCELGKDPASCASMRPRVDMNLAGPLAYTGDAYWAGRAYVSSIGKWLLFDWTCDAVVGSCSIEDRVHTDLETGEVSGYAWGGAALGWVSFGNSEEAQYIVAQTLPEEIDTVLVQPVVTLTPDPSEATKYGQGGGEQAPLADGVDHYTLSVQLVEAATGENLTDDYDVSINVTPTDDSRVYYNQVLRPEKSESAVFLGDVTYDSFEQSFNLPIYSWAPTSNVNGYDQDADGDLDFYFDHDPNEPGAYVRSDSANKYEIDSIDIEVTGPSLVEFVEIGSGLTAPHWGLSDNQLNLKFAPAIELTNLGRWNDHLESMVYSLPYTPDEELSLSGLVAIWSRVPGFQSMPFVITSILNSDVYYYVFDSNDDGNYIASAAGGDDTALMRSTFSGDRMTLDPEVYTSFMDTGYYVPIGNRTTAAGLGSGSNGEAIQKTMLVNEDGYTAPVAYVEGKSLFAKLFDWLNPFGGSLQANAAGSGPDLTVSNIYLGGSSGDELMVELKNIGTTNASMAGNAPYIRISVEGFNTLTYSSSTLSNVDFLKAGGTTTLKPRSLTDEGLYAVEACIDTSNVITELNEENNCFTTEIDTRDLPDLEVTDIQRDAGTGQLVVTVANNGPSDVVTYMNDPYIYIYIDGVREWTYSHSTLADRDFLKAGESSEIRPQVIDEQDQYIVEACVDARSVIDETDENNNCYQTTIISQTLYPDLIISGIYYDDASGELVVGEQNIGDGPVTNTRGETRVWVDGALQESYSWSSIDQGFMAVSGTSEIRTALAGGDYSVQACIDFFNVQEESDENNNCLFATIGSGADINPLYETIITYTPTGSEFEVSYYSSYMPLQAGEGESYNVPAYDGKLDPNISGSVTTAESIDEDFNIENAGGDLDTKEIRSQLYQRLKLLTKGVQISDGGTISGNMEADGGASLMSGSLLYFTGDVVLEDLDVDYDEVTIGVIGDVYIDSNILGEESVGIVVFRDSDGEGGNVYIHPDVTDLINLNVFADGGVYSYDGDRDSIGKPDYLGNPNVLSDWDYNTRLATLDNQLAWIGSLIADVTLTGTLDSSNMFLPNGESTNDRLLAAESCLMDLREFVLCWVQTDEYGTSVDVDGDGNYGFNADGSLDYGDMEECENAERSTSLDYTGDLELDNHTPFYFEYRPPSATLPVFSRVS